MEVRVGSVAGQAALQRYARATASSKTFEGRTLQLALAKPENVVVRLNGNRVELPAGTAFVVTARQIAAASSS